MMKLEKVKSLISSIAPTVGVALGGPLGGVAGQMVQRVLGVETLDQAASLLSAGDPEIALKLKEADLQFRQFMRDAEIRDDQLMMEDRQDARSLAKALGSSSPQMWIVVVLTALVGWTIYALFLEAPPKGSENVLYIILGQLTTAWTAAISFFVGTTKSSAEKNMVISQAVSR